MVRIIFSNRTLCRKIPGVIVLVIWNRPCSAHWYDLWNYLCDHSLNFTDNRYNIFINLLISIYLCIKLTANTTSFCSYKVKITTQDRQKWKHSEYPERSKHRHHKFPSVSRTKKGNSHGNPDPGKASSSNIEKRGRKFKLIKASCLADQTKKSLK